MTQRHVWTFSEIKRLKRLLWASLEGILISLSYCSIPSRDKQQGGEEGRLVRVEWWWGGGGGRGGAIDASYSKAIHL